MSKVVRRNAPFLRLLVATASKSQRKGLLDTITNDQLKALTEVIFNLLRGVIAITPSYRNQLRKQKKLIRLLGDKSVSPKRKRVALCRKGSVIAVLLKSVEPALNSLLT